MCVCIHAVCPIIRKLIQLGNKFKEKNIVTLDTLPEKEQLHYFTYNFTVEDTNRFTRTKIFQRQCIIHQLLTENYIVPSLCASEFN